MCIGDSVHRSEVELMVCMVQSLIPERKKNLFVGFLLGRSLKPRHLSLNALIAVIKFHPIVKDDLFSRIQCIHRVLLGSHYRVVRPCNIPYITKMASYS